MIFGVQPKQSSKLKNKNQVLQLFSSAYYDTQGK